jgi:hypothetical protein
VTDAVQRLDRGKDDFRIRLFLGACVAAQLGLWSHLVKGRHRMRQDLVAMGHEKDAARLGANTAYGAWRKTGGVPVCHHSHHNRSSLMPAPIRSLTALAAPVLAALALATPAVADEVWTIEDGEVIWEEDFDNVSVFSYPLEGGRGHLYIVGLNASITTRGLYAAYWIGEGDGPCEAAMTGPDGRTSTLWGWATVSFMDFGFPSGFGAEMGMCASPQPWDSFTAWPK